MSSYKSKKATYNSDELINKMYENLDLGYQIGLHQVGVFGTKESIDKVHKSNFFTRFKKPKPQDFCDSILKSGLMNRWENINYTLMCFGSLENIVKNKDGRKDEFLNYMKYDYEDIGNTTEKDLDTIIVAVPSHINIGNKVYDIGNLKHPADLEVDDKSFMKDELFKSKNIPEQFIYGYVHTHEGKYDLIKNEKHYSNMSREEQEQYMKNYLELNNINISSLEQLKNRNLNFTHNLVEDKRYVFDEEKNKNLLDRFTKIQEDNQKQLYGDIAKIVTIVKLVKHAAIGIPDAIKKKNEAIKKGEESSIFDYIEDPNFEYESEVEKTSEKVEKIFTKTEGTARNIVKKTNPIYLLKSLYNKLKKDKVKKLQEPSIALSEENSKTNKFKEDLKNNVVTNPVSKNIKEYGKIEIVKSKDDFNKTV